MKRLSVLIIVLCVLTAFAALLTGCGSNNVDDMLIEAGLESAARMKEAVCSETYRNLISASAMLNDPEMIDVVSGENVAGYKAIYEISFDPEKALGTITDRFEEYDGLSENLQNKIIAQVYGSLPSLINSSKGTSAMAFTGVFTDSGSIKHETLKEKTILVFVFESGYPIWVTYSSGIEGVVSYVSYWIIADCAQIDSEETLINELRINNVPTLEVKKIR